MLSVVMLNVLMPSVIAPWGVVWIFRYVYLIFLNLKWVLECTTGRERMERRKEEW